MTSRCHQSNGRSSSSPRISCWRCSYWLKLIRAFDERLSILVKQGKVRSGVYTGIGQEAIIVGTCFGLRREDYICPLHRDLGAFLMKGVSPRT